MPPCQIRCCHKIKFAAEQSLPPNVLPGKTCLLTYGYPNIIRQSNHYNGHASPEFAFDYKDYLL